MEFKLVYGAGLNDADYTVVSEKSGERVACPFYQTWRSMLQRCYSAKLHARHPTYIGCTVCDDWLIFGNFKTWMENQDWQGKQLDKDLLIIGNKLYSPKTCAFVNAVTNSFTEDCGSSRGAWPIGVSFYKKLGKFQAKCRNQFTKKPEHLGYFTCQNQAHQAWKSRKHELSLQLADLQSDERVANALRNRYI